MSQARIRPPSWRASRARVTARHWLTRPVVFALLLGLLPGLLHAQNGVVSGTVVAEGSLRPLANAQIAVEGQPSRGTITDAAGRFRLAGLSGTTVTLTARLLGFRQASRTAEVGATDVRFVLGERVVELNQVVVTGTAGGEQKRAIGTSVAQVSAAEVLQKTAVPSVDALLNGRAAGVQVLPGTGMVGAGARVRIRGIGSFSLSADPLIYVDGVRVDNQTSTGIAIQAFGSGVVSRLNDFDPEQIENIEILKGPAAATLYGTEAARGVINIITKKGTAGTTTYDFMARTGANMFQDVTDRIATNWCHVNTPTSCDPTGTGPLLGLNVAKRQDSLGAPIFRTGKVQDFSANISGGTGILRFFASAGLNNDEGVDPSNAQRKTSARTNLTITPSERVNIQTNFGYIKGHTTLSCEAGCGGLMWDAMYSTPANLPQFCAKGDIPCTWVQGFNGTPPAADAADQVWQDLDRVTASATLNFNPLHWLTSRLAIGTDVVQEGNTEFLPYLTNDTLAFFYTDSHGYRYDQRHQATYNTYDFNTTAKFDLPRAWAGKTSGGIQYYTNRHSFVTAEGKNFPAPGLETISSAGQISPSRDSLTQNNTLGFYGQQELSFAERLYLTGAVRVDNNSAFGSEVNWVTYPKLSLSYVLSEEPRLQSYIPGWMNSLRLRAAYGASGQQPGLSTALRTLLPVAGPNGNGILTPNTLGNENLKPERVLGTELGFEVGLLNDRLGVDFTYFRDISKDAILSRSVAPGTGFGVQNQFFNAGEIRKHGVEALIKAQLANHQRWGWDMTLNMSTNSAKITQLARSDTVIDLGFSAHRVGYAPFDYFMQRVSRVDVGTAANQASYNPATNTWTIPKASIYCATPSGGETPCYNASGSTVIAPKLYVGHSTPTFEGSWSNTIRFLTNFRLYSMFDMASGHRRGDNNIRIRCQLFHTCLEYVQPQNTDPTLLAQFFSGGPLREFVYADARYVKFRELSLSYDASPEIAGRIGAHSLSVTGSARNLHTWTNYSGLDPESQFVAGTPTQLDQAHLPQLLNFALTFHLSY